MNTTVDCERVRRVLMAALDGEGQPPAGQDQAHLATCASCAQWLEDMRSAAAGVQALTYPAVTKDLWPAVERRIQAHAQRRPLPGWVWPLGAGVLGWRVLQLFVDLPIPVLHPIGQLVAVVIALWLMTGHFLAIETSAPELQKRGV